VWVLEFLIQRIYVCCFLFQESIVPLVFGLRNILLIDQPSDFQRQSAKDSENKRLTMTDTEKKLLVKRTAKIIASNRKEATIANEEWGMPRVVSTKNGLGVKDRPQFKRNRAKVMNSSLYNVSRI